MEDKVKIGANGFLGMNLIYANGWNQYYEEINDINTEQYLRLLVVP